VTVDVTWTNTGGIDQDGHLLPNITIDTVQYHQMPYPSQELAPSANVQRHL